MPGYPWQREVELDARDGCAIIPASLTIGVPMSTTAAAQKNSTGAILLGFLGSMNLAIILLLTLAIASVIGTVLQQNQPYNNYVNKFGPFWFEVFKDLQLYDVYSAGWFVFILAFLLLSTSICIYRNAPGFLRDIRTFRFNVQRKSLASFKMSAEAEVDDAEEYKTYAAKALKALGYRVRVDETDERYLMSAMRGGVNRWGYIFAHLAIIVVCIGGMMDSKISLKMREMAGTLMPETRNISASEFPPESRLDTDTMAFRGTIDIPEGDSANLVFLPLRDGFLVQPLPFRIGVKDFRVEHYSTGMPKSFESDIQIFDERRDEPVDATIAVNKPLIYDGYAIYQASFGDGGSTVDLRLWPLNPEQNQQRTLQTKVFSRSQVDAADGPITLEVNDFRLFNINPIKASELPPEQRKASGPKGAVAGLKELMGGEEEEVIEQKNFGPSVVFKFRTADGTAREYMNYMNPVRMEGGRFYALSGVRDAPNEPFRFLHIPLGPDGTVQQFMDYVAKLHDVDYVRETITDTMVNNPSQRDMTPELRAQIAFTLTRLVTVFNEGGYEKVLQDIETRVPAAQREEATEAFTNMLRTAHEAVYLRMLGEKGLTPTREDEIFLQEALLTINVFSVYGAPYYVQMTGFEQLQATGLQISKQPGKNVVYIGSLMLTLGIFMMFYVAHRRLWLWLEPNNGKVLLSGTTNRNQIEFETEFERIKSVLLTNNER